MGGPAEVHIVLGGSWVVISGVISRVTVMLSHIRGLITPFIATHEPPSRQLKAHGMLQLSSSSVCIPR